MSGRPILPDPPDRAARLTRYLGRDGAVTLSEHRATFPRPPRPRRSANESLIAVVERAGLRGRGGASFPTSVKLRAVASGRRRPLVVANGSEGEPASQKDVALMTLAPHLVLDGAALAASAVGAGEMIVAVDVRASRARSALEHALRERASMEPSGLRARIAEVPPGYVSGEERALVHLLNRGPAIPTSGPRPFVRGIDGRPTLIQNVETLAHLATIHAFGPPWFREIGVDDLPGSLMLTVSGAVARPGVYEVEAGSPLREAIDRAGGAQAGIGAALVGGYAGSWLAPDVVERVSLDIDALRAAGATIGAGVVVVVPAGACGWTETARVLRWLAGQTADQCGPCVHGLAAIAGAAEQIVGGRGESSVVDRLVRWASEVEGRGACGLPDGAVRILRSALTVFETDVRAHAHGGGCWASRDAGWLPTPSLRTAA
jgi:NADH:ubiquinone oxidoreductase subunit F (NADH-binding)